MLTGLRDTLGTIWRRIYASTAHILPILDHAERTKSSWAKLIESYAAVPDPYKDFFDPFLAEGRDFPYTVLTPSYEGFINPTTEKLISDLGHEIAILERNGDRYKTQRYPLEGISYVEVRTILLVSRFKISGVTAQGVYTASTLKFNSITDYLLRPFLERIRLAPADSQKTVRSSQTKKFDDWVRVNFKFMNYAKRSLLGGEKVVHSILQPEIRKGLIKVLGKTFYRTISPTKVCILSDRELIVIQETEKHIGEERYGGAWDYIPLNKIEALSLDEKDGGILALSIHLPENERLEFLFQASTKPELDALLSKI